MTNRNTKNTRNQSLVLDSGVNLVEHSILYFCFYLYFQSENYPFDVFLLFDYPERDIIDLHANRDRVLEGKACGGSVTYPLKPTSTAILECFEQLHNSVYIFSLITSHNITVKFYVLVGFSEYAALTPTCRTSLKYLTKQKFEFLTGK